MTTPPRSGATRRDEALTQQRTHTLQLGTLLSVSR